GGRAGDSPGGRAPPAAAHRATLAGALSPTWAERSGGFSDVSVGWELDSRGSIWVPWNRRLQGLAQPSDDAGHVASTSIAAPASAWRAHRRHPHNVAFDQLQCVQSREQLRGARETLEAAQGPDACLHVAMIPLAAIGRDHEVGEPRG